jgi:hypothetical protein
VRIAAGELTRLQGTVRYGLWALVPLALYVALFFGAVGLEEWLGVAMISESVGRATLLLAGVLLGVAALGSTCFGVRCVFIKRAQPAGM